MSMCFRSLGIFVMILALSPCVVLGQGAVASEELFITPWTLEEMSEKQAVFETDLESNPILIPEVSPPSANIIILC